MEMTGEEIKKFRDYYEGIKGHYINSLRELGTPLSREFCEALEKGCYYSGSTGNVEWRIGDDEDIIDFCERVGADEVAQVLITDECMREAFFEYSRKLNQFQCSSGYCRRSVRSRSYAPHADCAMEMIFDYYRILREMFREGLSSQGF